MKAAFVSNLVWFAAQVMVFDQMKDMLDNFSRGEKVVESVAFALFYTFTTMFGSWLAHWWAIRTEKGSAAVGSSKRYAQIPVEEWEKIRTYVDQAPNLWDLKTTKYYAKAAYERQAEVDEGYATIDIRDAGTLSLKNGMVVAVDGERFHTKRPKPRPAVLGTSVRLSEPIVGVPVTLDNYSEGGAA
jgi:hypothetical protein